MKGLRKRPTYDELAEIVENNDDIIKKYPDRRAITMRNHPYLTTLDGESFLNALNYTQENMIKGQQRDLLVRTYAMQANDTSHLELRAQPENSPSSTVQTFDITFDDATMEVQDQVAQHLDDTAGKATVKKLRLKEKTRDMLRDVQKSSSSAAAGVMNVDLTGGGDNPETTHDPKGLPGRPLGSARPSPYSRGNARSSSDATSLSFTPAAVSEPISPKPTVKKSSVKAERTLKMDDNRDIKYWTKKPMEYIYKQLELDTIFITEPNESGEQQITNTGKNQQYIKKKLKKKDLIELLFNARRIRIYSNIYI